MITMTWKNDQNLNSPVPGLWFGLSDLRQPFIIFLSSLASEKARSMQKCPIWVLWHQEQFPNKIWHFSSLCGIKFQTWEIYMGPDRFWFFGFKALQKRKNFEIWTIFRYCKMRSKFCYITHLRDIGENSEIDFFQFFHFELYSYFHNDISSWKM